MRPVPETSYRRAAVCRAGRFSHGARLDLAAIAAGGLGPVYGAIGRLDGDPRGARSVRVGQDGPQADRHPQRSFGQLDPYAPDRLQQPLGHRRQLGRVAADAGRDELLAPIAAHQVPGPHGPPQRLRGGLQRLVPSLVAEIIVDPLEVVQVGHDQPD